MSISGDSERSNIHQPEIYERVIRKESDIWFPED